MIDEFDFGLYDSLIEDERFRDHYLDNNDDFYTRFLFHEGLTGYKSLNIDILDKNSIWYAWWDMFPDAPILWKVDQIIYKPDVEFDLIITWEGEEHVFERVENSKIFKRKYLIDE